VELTVLMPCLNEAETVATCVRKARRFLSEHDIDGEVLVADNGSTDGSQLLARDAGASVISIPDTGYGNAVLGGIALAQGQFIIMGDSDDSYDFTTLMPFLDQLRGGAELVMGNRFRGGIAPGAMPPLHRYVGNPVLSAIGRLFFRSRVGDFHCGLRGFRRDSVLRLALQASGMELASEMIVKATLAGQRVEEVPTRLSPDGRSRPPHLRRWRDGWRHLRFLLLFSPRWLFLIPGTVLLISGLIFGAAAGPTAPPGVPPTTILDDLVAASAMIVIGFQAVQFAVFTKVYASAEGFLQQRSWLDRLLSACSLERGLIAGGLLAAAGLAGLAMSVPGWHGPGLIHGESTVRIVVPSLTALVLSCQVILGTFFISILGIRRAGQPVLLAGGDGVAGAQFGPAQPGLAVALADGVPGPDHPIGLDVVSIDAWRLDPARKKVPGPHDAS
jgi:Glycosyl transferase family 2